MSNDKKIVSLVAKKEEEQKGKTPRELFEEIMAEDEITDIIIIGLTDTHSVLASNFERPSQICYTMDLAKLSLLQSELEGGE